MWHAAVLAVQLPLGSRTLAKIDPKLKWSDAEWLLLQTVNTIRGVFGNDPINPWEEAQGGFSLPADEYERRLNMPRREVVNDGR